MNIKYYNEFRGLDNTLYRIEILTNESATAEEIQTSAEPFVLKYAETRKLTPVQTAQANMELVSHENFQFTDLHTDNMQGYLIKFYRGGKLYWLGWLDPELYNERLSSSHPYYVSFSASDFNVLERLKYLDSSGNRFTGVPTLIQQLKRCFDSLSLPFSKLYIGCSTGTPSLTIASSETVLHVVHMMDDNFYDEDEKPMSCREVVESILQPFALMMVQKDGNVYIYDYNTLYSGNPMKRYDFATLAYEGEETVSFDYGDITEIGTMSTDGDYGFEEMYNNVTITSSIYADDMSSVEASVSEENVSTKVASETGEFYVHCDDVENMDVTLGQFAIFYEGGKFITSVGAPNTVAGCYLPYYKEPVDYVDAKPVFRVEMPSMWLRYSNALTGESPTKSDYFINVKMSAYPGTTYDFISEKPEIDTHVGVLRLHCNLYFVDDDDNILWYYDNTSGMGGWVSIISGTIPNGRCVLWFSQEDTSQNICDQWTTNGNIWNPIDKLNNYKIAAQLGEGLFIGGYVGGRLVLEVTNKVRLVDAIDEVWVYVDVKYVLLNDIKLSIVDKNGKEISTDDYEFRSYVNKNVEQDYENIELKCISANEDNAPIGRANMLSGERTLDPVNKFTRAGQTDILERLLMCTIHSNYTKKNEKFAVDTKIIGNPMMSHISYSNVLQGSYLVSGCSLNFIRNTVTINAVGYSNDYAKLTDITYD